MNKKINVMIYAAFILVIALTLFVIFGNSSKSVEESKADSNTVVEMVRPIIDPSGNMSDSELSFVVRKSGHFVEYMALGFECACFAYYICKKLNLTGAVCAAGFCLFVADMDEYFQSFTGRGSMVSDVLLDFCGALVGISVGFAISYVISLLIKNKKKAE